MKFGKDFMSQMVPEWQEAYMNYNYLKTLLKDIQTFRAKNNPSVGPCPAADGLKRRATLYRAFSGLVHHHRQHSVRRHHSPADAGDIESQTILVTSTGGGGHQYYTTTFMKAAEEGGELELDYFRRLDEEFNKVNGFYRVKVDEVMKEAALLSKQMDALTAFRIRVEDPAAAAAGGHWLAADAAADVEMTRLASDVAAPAATLAATAPHCARISGRRVTFTE